MERVGESTQCIQDISAYPSRRTSIGNFKKSLTAVFQGYQKVAVHKVHVEQNEVDLVVKHIEEAMYAFRTLHQRVSVRKFPYGLSELWPFIGLPKHKVAKDLGVSIDLLDRRMDQFKMHWPLPSTKGHLLLAVQVAHARDSLNNKFQVIGYGFVRIPRGWSLRKVHDHLDKMFDLESSFEEAFTEIHADVAGVRYGAIWTESSWAALINHPDNIHKLDILLVHYN